MRCRLAGVAGIGQRQDGIARCDHAEIAMAGFGGVNELRRRPGRGEGRRDLARDVSALAHAGDGDPPLGRRKKVDRLGELSAQLVGKRCQAGNLGPEDLAGDGKRVIDGVFWHSPEPPNLSVCCCDAGPAAATPVDTFCLNYRPNMLLRP
jgi:hypothetical protein